MGFVSRLLRGFGPTPGGVGDGLQLRELAGHPARVLLDRRHSNVDGAGRFELVVGEPDLVRHEGTIAVAAPFHYNVQAGYQLAGQILATPAEWIALLLLHFGKAAEL